MTAQHPPLCVCSDCIASAAAAEAAAFAQGEAADAAAFVVPATPCPTCGQMHKVCHRCRKYRVICPEDEPGVPFAWCEHCEADDRMKGYA